MRDYVENRPLVVFVVGLAIGLTTVAHPFHALFLFVLLGCFRLQRSWLVAIVASVVGVCLAPASLPSLVEPRFVRGAAEVVSVPRESGEIQSFSVEIEKLRLRVTAPASLEIHKGEIWKINVRAKPLSEASHAVGFQGSLQWSRSFSKLQDGPVVYRWADGWRRSFGTFCDAVLVPEDARWVRSLCFRNGGLELEEQGALVRTGTVHLVAASGLHIGVLALLLFGLMRFTPIPRAVQILLVGLALGLYCVATGLHMPTIRAVVGLLIGSSAYLFRRDSDALSALALGAGSFLLMDPASIYSVGFQLSVSIVGAVILFMPRFDFEERKLLFMAKGYAVETLSLSFIAAFVGEPILAMHTGVLSLANIPANFLAVLPACVVIWLAFIAYGLSFVSWAVAKPLMGAVAALVVFCRWAVVSLDRFSWAEIVLPSFSPYVLVPFFLIILAAWRPRARA